jgi:hypothetical protein
MKITKVTPGTVLENISPNTRIETNTTCWLICNEDGTPFMDDNYYHIYSTKKIATEVMQRLNPKG